MRFLFIRILSSVAIAVAVAIVFHLVSGVLYDVYGLVAYHNLARYRNELQENILSLEQTQHHLEKLQSESATVLTLQQQYASGYTASGEYIVEVPGYRPHTQVLQPGSIILSQYTYEDKRGMFRVMGFFIGSVMLILLVFTDIMTFIDNAYPRRRHKKQNNTLPVRSPHY